MPDLLNPESRDFRLLNLDLRGLASQEAIEGGRKVSPRISSAPHDCLKQIGRGTSGRHYHELAQAIRRLEATLVTTDIREADQPERGYERLFRWLKDCGIPKKYRRGMTWVVLRI